MVGLSDLSGVGDAWKRAEWPRIQPTSFGVWDWRAGGLRWWPVPLPPYPLPPKGHGVACDASILADVVLRGEEMVAAGHREAICRVDLHRVMCDIIPR